MSESEVPAPPTEEPKHTEGSSVDGNTLIAETLKQQGIESLFGIVGYPVYGVATAAQRAGLRYYGFRNEQAASYAAGAVGYLTGRPGACLTVSGPGMVHAIAGLANAWANCWPMLLLGGANDSYLGGRGAFQEAPQIEAARPFVKYAARPDSVRRIPYFVEQALRTASYGRPGAAYLDLPNDLLYGSHDRQGVSRQERFPDPPATLADPREVEKALAALRSAERPLVIIGKGAAFARAEAEVRRFIDSTQLPFLPTPMGKGVVPDDHPRSVSPARSKALAEADVILLIGARFNWILHFGREPRFAPDARILQIDLAAEQIGTNVPTHAAMVGDARQVVGQLNQGLAADPWTVPQDTAWWATLSEEVVRNRDLVSAMENDESTPMGYYRVLRAIREARPPGAILVSEGANTMDISRTVLPESEPRQRLDAGTFGTMGVGVGFAIAAAAVHADRKVLCVQGDSAFGFSGMEVEVACRHRLDITFVVVNNNGIAGGIAELDPDRPIPPSVYTPNARYERVIEAFGGTGYLARTPEELEAALKGALGTTGPALVNVLIDPKAARKPQKFAWMTR